MIKRPSNVKHDLGALPDRLQHDPGLIAWRIGALEHRSADHEDRLQVLEHSTLQTIENRARQIPWAKLALPILIIAACLFGLISPQEARDKLAALIGIVF